MSNTNAPCAVCGTATQFCCSQCFKVYYCRYDCLLCHHFTSSSETHQLQDWEFSHRFVCGVAVESPPSVLLPKAAAGKSKPGSELEAQLEKFVSDPVSLAHELRQFAFSAPFDDDDANLALLVNAAQAYVSLVLRLLFTAP